MKVVIEITPKHYQNLVERCDVSSAHYAVLKNGVIASDSPSGIDQRKIIILCEEKSAAALLDHALRVYPEAAPAIAARTNYTASG